MNEDNKDDEEHIFTKENQKYRIIKYYDHGILSKRGNDWIFESEAETREYEGTEGIELIELLNDLSQDGYLLVCMDGKDYILRSENVIEEIQGYWDTDEIESI